MSVFQWLCGLQPISHRTLSPFCSDNKDALGSVFVQVVEGVLSAEGLVTMERVTLDGTKIKANASGNTFRRKRRSKPDLAAAQTQREKKDEPTSRRGRESGQAPSGAQQRAAQERITRLEKARFVSAASAEEKERR